MNTLRIIKPTEIKQLAFECQDKDCGFIMLMESGKQTIPFVPTVCPACTASGRDRNTSPIQFQVIFDYLKKLEQNGARFVIPEEG
jgi:hypothetical protein